MSRGVKLVSLSLQQVGALDGRIDLGPFSGGVNVIRGRSEVGKSTLVAALRAALFERHDAGHQGTEGLQAHGTRNAPEVWVELDVGGERVSIHKRFFEKPLTEVCLHGEGAVFTGARAEEALLARLGGRPPDKHGEERAVVEIEDPAVQYRDLTEQLREAESKLPGLEAKHEAALAAEAQAQELERLARETESRLATAEARFEAAHEDVAARTSLARELEELDEEIEKSDGQITELSRPREEKAARRAVIRDELAELRAMVPDALLTERRASALSALGPAHTSARNAAAALDAVTPQLLRGEVLRAQGAIASCKRRARELHEKALARVMANDESPLPLILDDPMGWIDDGQLLSLVQILRNASSELQIILLTDHPSRFNRFQAGYSVDLDQLKDARPRAPRCDVIRG